MQKSKRAKFLLFFLSLVLFVIFLSKDINLAQAQQCPLIDSYLIWSGDTRSWSGGNIPITSNTPYILTTSGISYVGGVFNVPEKVSSSIGTFQQVCLRGDCRSFWPTGGGSGINYWKLLGSTLSPSSTAWDVYIGTTTVGSLCLGGVCRSTWPSGDGTGSGTNYWKLLGQTLSPSSTAWNVGIGTTNPQEKLDVAGNIKSVGNVIVMPQNATSEAGFYYYNKISGTNFKIYEDIDAPGWSILRSDSGKIGFEVIPDRIGLSIVKVLGSPGEITSPTATLRGSFTGIGINTTSPRYFLDIAGTFRAFGGIIDKEFEVKGKSSLSTTTIKNLCLGGVCRSTWPSGDGTNYWKLLGSNLYPSSTAWNVGIGTDNPNSKLTVASGTLIFAQIGADGRNYFEDSERAGRVRIGGVFNVPGIFSQEWNKDLYIGVNPSRKIFFGSSPTSSADAWIEGSTGNAYFKGSVRLGDIVNVYPDRSDASKRYVGFFGSEGLRIRHFNYFPDGPYNDALIIEKVDDDPTVEGGMIFGFSTSKKLDTSEGQDGWAVNFIPAMTIRQGLDGIVKIGIGTDNPNSKLTVASGTLIFAQIGADGRNYFEDSERAGRVRIGGVNGVPGIFSQEWNKDLYIGVNSSRKIFFGSSLTSSPDAWIEGSTGNAYFKGTTTVGSLCLGTVCRSTWPSGDGTGSGTNYWKLLGQTLSPSSTDWNVYIGTSSYAYRTLQVAGSIISDRPMNYPYGVAVKINGAWGGGWARQIALIMSNPQSSQSSPGLTPQMATTNPPENGDVTNPGSGTSSSTEETIAAIYSQGYQTTTYGVYLGRGIDSSGKVDTNPWITISPRTGNVGIGVGMIKTSNEQNILPSKLNVGGNLWVTGELNSFGNISSRSGFCIGSSCINRWPVSVDEYFTRDYFVLSGGTTTVLTAKERAHLGLGAQGSTNSILTIHQYSSDVSPLAVRYDKTGFPEGDYNPRRRLITIQNNSNQNLSYYPVMLKIPITAFDKQWMPPQGTLSVSDFSDVRFTLPDGRKIAFWIERVGPPHIRNDKYYVVFWVKIPSLPARATTNIYVYYGNPSLRSLSSADAVFEKVKMVDQFRTNWKYSGLTRYRRNDMGYRYFREEGCPYLYSYVNKPLSQFDYDDMNWTVTTIDVDGNYVPDNGGGDGPGSDYSYWFIRKEFFVSEDVNVKMRIEKIDDDHVFYVISYDNDTSIPRIISGDISKCDGRVADRARDTSFSLKRGRYILAGRGINGPLYSALSISYLEVVGASGDNRSNVIDYLYVRNKLVNDNAITIQSITDPEYAPSVPQYAFYIASSTNIGIGKIPTSTSYIKLDVAGQVREHVVADRKTAFARMCIDDKVVLEYVKSSTAEGLIGEIYVRGATRDEKFHGDCSNGTPSRRLFYSWKWDDVPNESTLIVEPEDFDPVVKCGPRLVINRNTPSASAISSICYSQPGYQTPYIRLNIDWTHYPAVDDPAWWTGKGVRGVFSTL